MEIKFISDFSIRVGRWLNNSIFTLNLFLLEELIFYLFEVKLYLILLLATNIVYACALGTGRAGRFDERIFRCRSTIILLGQQLLR